jgi:hypothetical protein
MATAFMDFARDYYTHDGVLDRKAFGEFGNLSTQQGRDDFNRLGNDFLNQVTGNRVAEIEAETMHKPTASDLQAPKDVAGAERSLGVSVPDQGQFHIASDKAFARLTDAAPASPLSVPQPSNGHTSHKTAPGHHGNSGTGAHGSAAAPGSPSGDTNGLPAPIGFHGGTSSIVDAGLSGHTFAHATNAADIAAGRTQTGGAINTKPTIVGDTDDTYQKMNHGQPLIMAGLRATGLPGQAIDGIGQGAHIWNEHNNKTSDSDGNTNDEKTPRARIKAKKD